MSTSRNLTALVLVAVMAGSAYAKGDSEDEKIRAEVQKQIDERLAAALGGSAYAKGDAEDERIRAEVQKRIDERPSLKFDGVSVRTVNHAVYLEGLVDTNFDRRQAEAIARAVPGVTKVHDKLVLNADGWPRPEVDSQAGSTRPVEGQASSGD